jgi:hypothetical protein
MLARMSHVYSRNRFALLFASLSLALLVPVHASAQGFDLVKVSRKSFPEVNAMLGKPIEATGSPITYARYNTAGAIDTIVWYKWNTGQAMKSQVVVLAKPGETYQEILKRYHLSLGPNPKDQLLKKPMFAFHNSGPVAGVPWMNVLISYTNVMPFQTGSVKYCKDHGLNPSKTMCWTLQVRNSGGGGPSNVVNNGSAPASHGKGGHRKKK